MKKRANGTEIRPENMISSKRCRWSMAVLSAAALVTGAGKAAAATLVSSGDASRDQKVTAINVVPAPADKTAGIGHTNYSNYCYSNYGNYDNY